jgi:hypothetical protein
VNHRARTPARPTNRLPTGRRGSCAGLQLDGSAGGARSRQGAFRRSSTVRPGRRLPPQPAGRSGIRSPRSQAPPSTGGTSVCGRCNGPETGLEHTRGGRSHPLGGKVGLTVRPEPPDRRWLRQSPRPRSARRGSTRDRLSCRPHPSRHRACPRRCRSPDHPSPPPGCPSRASPRKRPLSSHAGSRGSERERLALKSWASRGRPDCVILPDSCGLSVPPRPSRRPGRSRVRADARTNPNRRWRIGWIRRPWCG